MTPAIHEPKPCELKQFYKNQNMIRTTQNT